MTELEEAQATDLLERNGYVVLKAKSYHAAQTRHTIARNQLGWAERDAEHTREWAIRAYDEQRRLSDRLNFVYGVAKAKGATDKELEGCSQCLPLTERVSHQ